MSREHSTCNSHIIVTKKNNSVESWTCPFISAVNCCLISMVRELGLGENIYLGVISFPGRAAQSSRATLQGTFPYLAALGEATKSQILKTLWSLFLMLSSARMFLPAPGKEPVHFSYQNSFWNSPALDIWAGRQEEGGRLGAPPLPSASSDVGGSPASSKTWAFCALLCLLWSSTPMPAVQSTPRGPGQTCVPCPPWSYWTGTY